MAYNNQGFPGAPSKDDESFGNVTSVYPQAQMATYSTGAYQPQQHPSTTHHGTSFTNKKENLIPVIASLCVLGVGFLLFIIGFSTDYWVEFEVSPGRRITSGLWRQCVQVTDFGKECGMFVDSIVPLPDTFIATQVMACFGLIGCVFSAVMTVGFLFMEGKTLYIMKILTALCSLGTAGCITVTVFIYGVDNGVGSQYFDYSFYLCAVSAVPVFFHEFLILLLIKASYK